MNLTAIAHGEPPIHEWFNYVNFSGMADGVRTLRVTLFGRPDASGL